MIKVNNLSKSYGEIKAVQNISFESRKEIYAFWAKTARAKAPPSTFYAPYQKTRAMFLSGQQT